MKTDAANLRLPCPALRQVFGVDFSGAAVSGKTTWMAATDVSPDGQRLRLVGLQAVGDMSGDHARAAVTRFLVEEITRSQDALWGLDFPFGLPTELGLGTWRQQLNFLTKYSGNAKELGRQLVARSQELGHTMHVRRLTDRETRTPFDCYHYRIIYQTFHGMRDVLGLLARDRSNSVLPFQYRAFQTASRWIVEACPSSTLKRLGLPYRLYKQSAGKPPTPAQASVRNAILEQITHRSTGWIDVSKKQRQVMLSDSGGDALDAVVAAVGSFTDFRSVDHDSIARHTRYKHEGRVYA